MLENIIILLSIATAICLAIYFVYSIGKVFREHNRYINSIKVGDVFEMNDVSTLVENPFGNKFEYAFTRLIITDIKKDNIGMKWVKYKCLKTNIEDSCPLSMLIQDYTRIINSNLKYHDDCYQTTNNPKIKVIEYD